MKPQLQNVKTDFIRYANCWEDADVLLQKLDAVKGDRLLSIGSGGDNTFSLLTTDPEKIVVCDINAAQLRLIRLKIAAFSSLNHSEFLFFLGFQTSNNRTDLFKKVSLKLSQEDCEYWTRNINQINEGLIYQGKFERYLLKFSRYILPLIHSKKTIHALFESKTAEAQKQFFSKKWNSLRWRMFFQVFFSKYVLGKFGRDPAFLNEVEIPVSKFLLQKSTTHLSSVDSQDNYFLKFILTGEFGENLPHYAQEENFELIKSRIDRLVLVQDFAENALGTHSNINKLNLSNIFEYMDKETFRMVAEKLVSKTAESAVFVYWNLMVPRMLHSVNSDLANDISSKSQLKTADKGFFYSDIFRTLKK